MKKPTSVKARITIWYTCLMLVLMAVVLASVGTLAYRMTNENIEKDVTLRVTQVSEQLTKHRPNVFESIDRDKEFKNVSIYSEGGKHIAGQYVYDIASIEFKQGAPRREKTDREEYIVYDVFKRGEMNGHGGIWIRGAESVASTALLARSALSALMIIVPLILLLTALGGYYITGKAFLPVEAISKTANEISEQNNISERIELAENAKHDELYELSLTLNRMLDKTEELINREKRFTSDASHELRTPVSVILAQGEYLAELAQSDRERELAESVVDKAKQMSRLISALLFLARTDQNRQKLKLERVDLCAVSDIAIREMQTLAAEKGILLMNNIDEGFMLEGDEALLLSAIENLVSNGIKYGREEGYVAVSAVRFGNCTEITVADNGVGISAANLGKIWDRFYRVDDVRNDSFGSCGLGLSVVKGIAELHGGTATAFSEEGHGTVFKISLKDDGETEKCEKDGLSDE